MQTIGSKVPESIASRNQCACCTKEARVAESAVLEVARSQLRQSLAQADSLQIVPLSEVRSTNDQIMQKTALANLMHVTCASVASALNAREQLIVAERALQLQGAERRAVTANSVHAAAVAC